MSLKEEIAAFLIKEFPQTKVTVEAVGNKLARVKHKISTAELRPGGTVSGPVMMAVADVALYVAILGEIGLEALTVTTSLSINFLRKPSATSDIIGECRLMKLGKKLVVGEVTIYSEDMKDPVAHAVGTYSIPPRQSS
ncbi:PaaI family thioesterase [Pontibacter rugosus]|uniref:PaaI family thioesterase n=1 Tax=Pontibacter rugosus TaxID=1745966 RepID=A0ABW3ST33_9BACT